MSTSQHRVLCIGDIALDVIVKLDIDGGSEGLSAVRYGSDTPSRVITRGGGAAANVAAWLSTTEAKAELIARIGCDSVGEALVTELEEDGVICHRILVPDVPTGTVVVIVDRSGERTMFPDSGANARLTSKDLPELSGLSAAYISGYSLFNRLSHAGVVEICATLKRAGIPTIFDPASVGTMSTFGDREKVTDSLPKSDVMILNESEARFLADAPSDSLDEVMTSLTRFATVVVIKRNESGAIALDSKTGERFNDRQSRHEPVDSTGAGDSFAAGFIAEWIKERDLLASIKSGNLMAGQCVQVVGARPVKSP